MACVSQWQPHHYTVLFFHHLLTREALRGYLARPPHGMILMHISNRHVELAERRRGSWRSRGLVTFSKADANGQ